MFLSLDLSETKEIYTSASSNAYYSKQGSQLRIEWLEAALCNLRHILWLSKLNVVYMGFVQSYLIRNIMRRRLCLDYCKMLISPDGGKKVAVQKCINTTSLHTPRLKIWLSIITVAEWPLSHLIILVFNKELSRNKTLLIYVSIYASIHSYIERINI